MKRIIIKKMRLVNFKGVRNLEAEFSPERTEIRGRNATGKTTIFDAFTYLLFGKDSQGRRQFGIKTLGPDGKVIERLPHEVSATLVADGRELTLTRRYEEKWQKRRGETVETFTGNQESFLWDGVPVSLSEWQSRVSGLCPEPTFRMITSPAYFPSLAPAEQRAMLLRMAGGEASLSEVAAGKPEFEEFVSALSGKTLADRRAELAAKAAPLKKEMAGIPPRVDELQRQLTTSEDWGALEKELEEARKERDKAKKALSDESERVKAASDARAEAARGVSALRARLSDREAEVRREALKEYEEARAKADEVQSEYRTLVRKEESLKAEAGTVAGEIERNKTDLEATREKWFEVARERLLFPEGAFVCPTCRRALEPEDVEAKKRELEESFNKTKAGKKAEVNAKGQALKEEGERLVGKLKDIESELAGVKERITALEADMEKSPVRPDADAAVAADEEAKRLREELEKAEEALRAMPDAVTDGEAAKAFGEADSRCYDLEGKLAGKKVADAAKGRIAELEEGLRKAASELAEIERQMHVADELGKARVRAVEDKINALFHDVRWKLFDTQVNGAEVETCEATVGGVPYSGLNSAARVNAGLDIIDAICLSEGVGAPIFIDNAESVNNVRKTFSQQVLLRVTTGDLSVRDMDTQTA